ncbi:MAG: PAAR domain-containing protein [Ilumatobacteraceae bacterium]
MGLPAATANSQVVGVDIHIVMVPTPGGPVPAPLPHVFSGTIQSGVVMTVKVGGQPVATLDSVAANNPPHIASPPGVMFQKPPANQGKVVMASSTVTAGGKGIARVGDQVSTCNDPADVPVSTIIGPAGTVMIG